MANDDDLFDHLAAWLLEERLREQVLALNPRRLHGFDRAGPVAWAGRRPIAS